MKKILAIAGLCAAMGLAGAPSAEAAIQLTLSSGGSTVTVDDGGIGDSNPAAGLITYIGAVGGWTFNVTTGSIVGSPNPLIDLNSVNTTLSAPQVGANALTMTFSGTDFNLAPGVFASIGGTLAGGHSLDYSAYYSNTNTLNALTSQIGSTLSFGPGGAFAGSTAAVAIGGGLYSLTQRVVLSATANGTSSFDANVMPVPEPASLMLLGSGMLGVARMVRRRRQQNA